MKQSKFNQIWQLKGSECTVTGVIEVEIDVIIVNSHDKFFNTDIVDVKRINKIIGFIDDVEYKSLHSDSLDGVLETCARLKEDMNLEMIKKSNIPKDKTFLEKMESLGFNVPKGDSNNKGLLCG